MHILAWIRACLLLMGRNESLSSAQKRKRSRPWHEKNVILLKSSISRVVDNYSSKHFDWLVHKLPYLKNLIDLDDLDSTLPSLKIKIKMWYQVWRNVTYFFFFFLLSTSDGRILLYFSVTLVTLVYTWGISPPDHGAPLMSPILQI